MPTTVKIRRSGTASATPSALEHGEIAINYADGKVFWKNASDVITSFTFQSYALASHTHAASDITSGTLDIARIPTGSTSSTVCIGNDARLSDTRTPTDGSVTTAKLANDAVTYAKIQNVSATNRLLGRSSAGAGDVEEITCTSFGRSLIDDADAAAARTTLSVQPTASPTFTGSVQADVSNVLLDSTGNLRVFTTDTQAADKGGQIGLGGKNGYGAPFDPWAFATIKGAKENGTSGNLGGYVAFATANAGGVLGERLRISSTGTATFAGQVLVTAGSVSACSVAPTGDPNTGLYFPAADVAAIVTNGTERMRVDASGNVGIGVAPSTQLHIGSLGVFRLQTGSVTMDCTPTAGALDGFVWNTNPASYYQWNTGGTQRLLIGSDGKITCKGLYDNTVGATNRDVFVDSGGVVGYVSSIRESKTDIVTLDDVSWLSALSPVSYRYRKRNADGTYSDEADGVTDYGLIAEDVEAVRPELCFYDMVDGEPQLRGVTYSKLITPMLRYIQQLEQRITALEERLSHA